MTDAEKGALLLAAHEGKVIEWFHPNTSDTIGWGVCDDDLCLWDDEFCYRIRPEPKRETVTLYGPSSNNSFTGAGICDGDTHRITFDLIDGKPDPDSIKMERIND
jgi:hypothetical protein